MAAPALAIALSAGCVRVSATGPRDCSPPPGPVSGNPGDTAIAYVVNDYYSACGGTDLRWCDNFGAAFRSTFRRAGWRHVPVWYDQDVRARDWADGTKATIPGADLERQRGVDSASVALICGHGFSAVETEPGFGEFMGYSATWLVMGSQPDLDHGDDCMVNTKRDLLFGNTTNDASSELEIAILATCSSAEWSVWASPTGYWPMIDPNGRFSTWLGFHGISYDSAEDTDLLRDYLSISFMTGLGDNWLDVMYRPVGEAEQCPTSIVFCTDNADGGDCDEQQHLAGFNDRDHVREGARDKSSFYFLQGCQPKYYGEALP